MRTGPENDAPERTGNSSDEVRGPAPGLPIASRPAARAARGAGALAGMLLAAQIITTFIYLSTFSRIPVDLEYPEGAVVARTFDFARGGAVYRDWREWPHPFAPYGPLTYVLPGLVVRATGAAGAGAGTAVSSTYAAGRGQSFLALVLIAACLCGIARRIGLPWFWAMAAPAPGLIWDKLTTFSASYRPDAPTTALSLAALWVALGGPPTRRRAFAAFAMAWVGFWFKPTGFAVPLALAAWFGFGGGLSEDPEGPAIARGFGARRAGLLRAGAALAAFAAAGLIVLWAINRATGGLFLLNLAAAADNGYSPLNLKYALLDATERLPGSIMLIGLSAAVWVLARGPGADVPAGGRDDRTRAAARLWATATPLSLAIGMAQACKFGANSNYFLEFYLLAAVGAVFAAWRAAGVWTGGAAGRAGGARRAFAWGMALACAWFLWRAAVPLSHFRLEMDVMRNVALRRPRSVEVMREIDGPVLAQAPHLALARPAPPTLMDGIHYAVAREHARGGAGAIPSSPMVDKIRSGEFNVIVLSRGDWNRARAGDRPSPSALFDPAVVAAIQSRYAVAGEVDQFVFLRPVR